ncbi:hypothetical protein HNO92_003732 [Chromobacterium alkanivorans]|uniref:hypothetical protein n=1 Tax=Chromobacterium alkanivorans TaxID=1071719 RepID=UPI00196777A6|nr:hypothetical protein [Chromobacterium alkanivorans]MBN3005550.1 hypothetical protein [Chromobacterium alkanivorans]MCS3806357.1 hypothetical protein [Chromobacterium alkanivorans]MCS3820631.1 hypothetical protein [Chromobacterium alkanivorans]MCS3875389.1 hypothetical protein [Chromobacterium alkanivorans]
MDLMHSTLFWIVIAAAPAVTALGILIRLARREPPPDLPAGVKPLGWDDEERDEDAEPPTKGD